MTVVRIFCASDRLNYGDLLFPLISLEVINKLLPDSEVKIYALINSDLSGFGALPTSSFKELHREIQNSKRKNLIFVAGGEVLQSNWVSLHRFISTFWNYICKIPSVVKIDNTLGISKRVLGRKDIEFPFIFKEFPLFNIKIVYNGVGGTGTKKLLKRKDIRAYFSRVDYLSVRDNKTYRNFLDVDVKCNLCPDPAIIISKIFNYNVLKDKCNNTVIDFVNNNPRFIFLQLGKKKGPDDVKKFCEFLVDFANKNNLAILLSPIGIASGHEDQRILKKMKNMMSHSYYIYPNNLFETMFLISQSSLFLGSSLHGVVTSQSFGVPYMALTDKIPKLKFYIETWGRFPQYEIISYKNLELIYSNYSYLANQNNFDFYNSQKDIVYENFNRALNA